MPTAHTACYCRRQASEANQVARLISLTAEKRQLRAEAERWLVLARAADLREDVAAVAIRA